MLTSNGRLDPEKLDRFYPVSVLAWKKLASILGWGEELMIRECLLLWLLLLALLLE